MHCPNCGQQTSSEVKFCRACGLKLDSVVRAVGEHNIADPTKAGKERNTGANNSFFNPLLLGIVILFIGITTFIAGQGLWGATTVATVLTLLGLLITGYNFIPMAARYDRQLLKSRQNGEKREIEKIEPKPSLPEGEDFNPVSSITEGTTRDLDKNRTKVLR